MIGINILRLDAINLVPHYSKLLAELCTTTRKLKGNEKISAEENVSAVSQMRLPLNVKTQFYSLLLARS